MLKICKYLSCTEIVQMLIGFAFIVAQVWLDLKLPDYMSKITTLVETPGSSMHDVWVAGGKMLVVAFGSFVCSLIVGLLAALIAASFGRRLRSLQFNAIENTFGPAEMSHFSTASLITRSTNDITQVQLFITIGLQLLVRAPIMAVWAIAKIADDGIEWTMATGIAVTVLMVMVTILMALVMPKFKRMQTLTDNINLVARENLTGLRVVRAYNAEDYQEQKFSEANRELTDTQLFTNRAMSVMMPVMNTALNGLMLAVYWIGAYLIDAADMMDKLTIFSNMVVFSSYSIQVIMSFLLMSMVFVLWPRADVSAKRILEVITTKPVVNDSGSYRGETERETSRETSAVATRETAVETGDEAHIESDNPAGNHHGVSVAFDNVSFTYPDSREPMLENISFTAKPGQTVAFIGSTGSGKSTLVNLVPRLYDATQGRVLVDGKDVREWDSATLRAQIGYVPQKALLFKGTVASNIAYGGTDGFGSKTETNGDTNAQIDMNRVQLAAQVAQASEFINRFEKGYESPISQGGTNVSGGQRQRLSIARAVYTNPSVYVFDDSFSALDFATDRAVREQLREHAQGATKLIVAQRVGTIMDADMIVVLDDGKVVGKGTHRELLETCDVYQQIARSQLTEEDLKK